MRKHLLAAGLATGVFMGLATAASAQNYDGDPTYGEISLSAGFEPDPSLTSLLAGGSIDASTKFDSCQGFIAEDPDVRLIWDGSAKSALKLKLSVLSNADTTLVVNGPDGRWHCDDDGGDDSNPSLELTPMPGRYEIWVGTYTDGETKRSVLSISETSSF